MASSKALYRKYRPTKLSEVIGQSGITDTLENSLKQGKISHAYLFIGPRGTGKTSVARILAHAVNNFDYQVEDSYLDIIEIDAASNTGVDNIRELREKSVIAPTKGKYKVYIIDEIHMLTKSASNALLKTLEEPPEHVIYIMATTDAHKVPITISSRAQVHTFQLAEPSVMKRHLRHIADQEGIKITDQALEVVVRRGGGSFRDSLSLLDQITTLTDQEITAELLNSALGLPETKIVQNLLNAYISHDIERITNLIHDLLNSGLQPEILTSELIDTIITHPEPALLPLLARLPDVKPPFPEAKFLLAFLSDLTNLPKTDHTSKNTPKNSETTPETSQITAKSAKTAEKNPLEDPKSPKTPVPEKAPEHPASTPKSLKTPENSQKQPIDSSKDLPKAPENQPENNSKNITSEEEKASTNAQNGDFSWDSFLAQVQAANTAIHSQLGKVSYKCLESCLHIYPTQKFTKNILEKPGNRDLLISFLPADFSLQIHEVGAISTPKDATISQISDIMGNVQEVNSDLPF